MFQKTIKNEVILSGIALHSGKKVSAKIIPAGVNCGISFTRADIKGRPTIKASVNNVSSTKRGTNLGTGKAKILTIEHLLSAFSGIGITNAKIELSGPELPIIDGSSREYVRALIKKAGIKKQSRKIKVIKLKDPVIVGSGNSQIMAFPSDRFVISFMINYPGAFIGSQTYVFDSKSGTYEKEIAPARTYGFMHEVKALKEAGLIKGATLNNAIGITKCGYSTKLRFKNELVRHKILDLIGDLALTGCYIQGHIVGIGSGHELNVELAKKLLKLL